MGTRAALLISVTLLLVPAAADAQFSHAASGAAHSDRAYQPWPYPYRPAPWSYPGSVAVRIDVEPTDAEVFVNGYQAGTVDDFDGVFQRLRLRPGEHEITIYRDGYRTVTERRYFNPDAALTIRRTLQPLAPGEVQEPRPAGAPAPAPSRSDPDRPEPPRRADRTGSLSLRVDPADAEIVVDDERRSLTAGQTLLTLPLAPGRHRLEVRRDGYQTYTEDVLIRPEATLSLTVTLKRR